jgi:hypothetical protein
VEVVETPTGNRTVHEAAYQRLLANDKEQLERASRVNAPFTRASPLDVERSKAEISIQALSVVERTKEQDEQFADYWALLGRYDVALAVTKDEGKKAAYNAIIEAIERDDSETCPHPAQHKFVKQRVYSEKHGKEKSLVQCNVCGFQNVTATPDHIKKAMTHQGNTMGMSIDQAKTYHSQNVK